jgi:hypothetical protein
LPTSNHISAVSAASEQVRVISCAWGAEHVLDFLEYCLPALLSPGNLPAMCDLFDCELVFLTEESRFDVIAEHSSWRNATRVCRARLGALDDLLVGPDSYGMTLTQALHRGFADYGPAMTSNWQLFFNSDFVVADGGLKCLAQRMRAGHRLILAPSYCVNSEPAKKILNNARDPRTGAITVTNRSMAATILRHRHATVRGKTINQPLFSYLYNDQFYWLVDNYTLIGHQTPIAMVAMMPLVYLPKPTTYWDYGIIQDFLPNVSPLVLSDSDDFVMAEIRPTSTGQNNLRLGPRALSEMAASLHNFATRETVKISEYQLMLHSWDKPAGLKSAQAKLAEVVRQVILQAGTLPHHHEHFQWSAQIDQLQNRQNAYWESRLRSLPPEKRQASTTTPVRVFPKSGEALAASPAVVSAAPETRPGDRFEPEEPFGRIDEGEIAKAMQCLFEPAIISPPLTEASAFELSVRFMQVVDLLLQHRFFGVQEVYRRVARVAITTLLANPSAEIGGANLVRPLRLAVRNISENRHAFDSISSEVLSEPLATWIQTVWVRATWLNQLFGRPVVGSKTKVLLSDLLAARAVKPMVKVLLGHILTLAVVKPEIRSLIKKFCELPAIRPRVRASVWRILSDPSAVKPYLKESRKALLKELQELFPVERSREDIESEMAGLIRQSLSSEVVDVEGLGSLFARLGRFSYDRTLLTQLSALEMTGGPEDVLLPRMSELSQAFIEQFRKYAHLLMSHKVLRDNQMRRRGDQFRALLHEMSDTLKFVEKLADSISEQGILGMPLAPQGSPLRGSVLWRFFKRKLRLFHHLHASEVQFSKFMFERGSLRGKAILHIDAGASFSYFFTEDARIRYWLPLSIARSPLPLNLEQVRAGVFDLCIVDVGEEDLMSWSSVYKAVEPMTRSGCVVMFFGRNMRGLDLRRDDPAFIRGMFSTPGYARISYTDSKTAQLATRIVEFVRGIYRSRNLPTVIIGVVEVTMFLAVAPFAWSATLIEHCRKWPPSAKVPVRPISVAMEVSVP